MDNFESNDNLNEEFKKSKKSVKKIADKKRRESQSEDVSTPVFAKAEQARRETHTAKNKRTAHEIDFDFEEIEVEKKSDIKSASAPDPYIYKSVDIPVYKEKDIPDVSEDVSIVKIKKDDTEKSDNVSGGYNMENSQQTAFTETKPLTKKEAKALKKKKLKEFKKNLRLSRPAPSIAMKVTTVIFSFIFGFVFAIAGTIGAVVLFLTNAKVKDIMAATNLESEKYLTEEFAETNLMGVIELLKNQQINSVADIEKITPMVGTVKTLIREQVENLTGMKDLITEEALDKVCAAKFEDVAETLRTEILYPMPLHKILSVMPASHSLLRYLSFGIEGKTYELMPASEYNGQENVIKCCDDCEEYIAMKEISSSSTPISPMESEKKYYQPITIGTLLSDEVDEGQWSRTQLINNITIDAAFGDFLSGNNILYEIKDLSLLDITEDVGEVFKRVTIGHIFSVNADSPSILIYLAYGDEDNYTKNADGTITCENPRTLANFIPTEEDVEGATESLSDIIKGLELGDIITIDENSNELVKKLANYSIGEFIDGETFNELIGDVKIGDIINVGEDSNEIMKKLAEKTIDDLKQSDAITKLLDEIKIGDLITDENPSSIIKKLIDEGYSINDLTNGDTFSTIINDLKIRDIIEVGDDSSAIFKKIADYTIGQLSNGEEFGKIVNDLTLGEIITIDSTSSQIMQTLKDKTISEITGADIMNEIFLKDVIEIDEESGILMYLAYGKGTYDKVGGKIVMKDMVAADTNGAPIVDAGKVTYTLDGQQYTLTDETINVGGKTITVLDKDGKVLKFEPSSIGNIADKITNIQRELTIGDIVEITPTSSLIMRTLKNNTIEDLTNPETINNLKISEVIETGDSKILQAFATNKTTIGDLSKQETIENLKISDIIDAGDSKILQAFAGKGTTIKDLSSQETINNLKISEIINAGDSKLLQALANKKIEDLSKQETIENLKISDIIEAGDSKLLQAFETKGTTIKDLSSQETINGLHLNEIMDIDSSSPRLLQTLAGKTIGELTQANTINSLTLGELLEIKTEGTGKSSDLIIALKDTTINDLTRQETIDGIGIDTILTAKVDSSALIKYLVYGNSCAYEGNTSIENVDGTPVKYSYDGSSYNQSASGTYIKYMDGEYYQLNGTKITRKGAEVTVIDSEGKAVEFTPTTIGNLDGRIQSVSNDLTIGEIASLNPGTSTFMAAIAGSTIGNITKTVNDYLSIATLNVLVADGLISISSSTLNQTVTYWDAAKNANVTKAIGNFTVSGLLDAITSPPHLPI